MIRAALFLILVGLLALGAAWLADRPGEIAVTWLGYRIETSVMVGFAAIAILAALAVAIWGAFRFLLRSPGRLAHAFDRRRTNKGQRAISHGLIAIGAGDARAAQRHAQEAQRNAPSHPLTLLLRAQTAQLLGDRKAAEQAFRAMTARQDTKLLGFRGLYIEAQRHDDPAAAQLIAEAAARSSPSLPWAAEAALQSRCAAADWEGALSLVEANVKAGLVDKKKARRQRAVLLTARALAAEERERPRARAYVLEAVRLAPDLAPATALAGRLLAETGETRRAARILETAWIAYPHPDLAEAYAHLRLSDSARDRLARVRKLVSLRSGDAEGALALARAALDAREFAEARAALAPLLPTPTQRVAMLMAELEELEHGDEGRAREWVGRAVRAARDPAWTADGFVSERWLPVSPVTGRLDAFEWKAPIAELDGPKPIDQEPSMPGLIESAGKPAIEPARATASDKVTAPAPSSVSPLAQDRIASAHPVSAGAAATAETIIPLVHAPDDPGPETEPVQDEGGSERPESGWRRFRALFR